MRAARCFLAQALTMTLFALLFSAGAAQAQSGAPPLKPPSLVIVYDVSASMWDQVNKFTLHRGKETRRFEAAQEFATDLIERLAKDYPRHRAILYLFGANRTGDCTDRGPVGEFVPLASPEHRAGLRRVIESLQPRGRTPLALAFEDAARLLDGAEDPVIILVTDGKEECEEVDTAPCERAAQAKTADPRLIAHVVGIALPTSIVKKVSCIAENTGGSMSLIDEPEDIEVAINTIALAAPQPAEVPLSLFASVAPSRTFADVQPQPRIRLINRETDVEIAVADGSLSTTVRPGAYRIEFSLGGQVRARDVAVDQGSPGLEVQQVFNPGTLKTALSLPDSIQFEVEPTVDWRIELLELADGRTPVTQPVEYRAPQLNIALPPGRYRISAYYNERNWPPATVTILPDGVAEVTVPVN
jgi:Ca-activated chloride channel homolog